MRSSQELLNKGITKEIHKAFVKGFHQKSFKKFSMELMKGMHFQMHFGRLTQKPHKDNADPKELTMVKLFAKGNFWNFQKEF